MPQSSDWYVGKRLFVGQAVPPAANLGIGPAEIRGSAFIEGPLDVGSPIFAPGESNVCISRCINLDAVPPPISLVKIRNNIPAALPTDVIIGDPVGPVGVTVFCGPSFFTVQATAVNMVEQLYFNLNVLREEVSSLYTDLSNKIFTGYKTELGVDHNYAIAINSAPVLGKGAVELFNDFVTPVTTANTTFGIAVKKKSFDIPHPSKEGYRLRHVCVEGPTADVMYRGRMKDTNIINLPEYWIDLVDPETITVHLTPIGSFQPLYYKELEWGKKFRVYNSDGGPINCSFVIYGERVDGERNIPEYEGLTPLDYPGDNTEYNVNK
jgi:hypothetical protein